MFVEISRLFIVLTCTLTGLGLGREIAGESSLGASIGGMLGTLVGYVGGGVMGRSLDRAMGAVEERVDRIAGPKIFAVAIGAVVAGLAGAFAAAPLVLLLHFSAPAVLIGGFIIWVSGALGARLAWNKSDSLFALAGLSTRPLVRSQPFGVDDGHIVDTSAIMDAKMGELARAGFLSSDLFVPRFVLDELQGFADAREGTQARRARRGLEVLEALRRDGTVHLRILDDEVPEVHDVDAKLALLARRLEIRLLTCDAQLQKVAELQGVQVLNLRRLAADLQPDQTPGDQVVVELVKPGKEPGQGVGYLDDGSMVVVNGGAHLVGAGAVAVTITTTVPTSMGRLHFASIEGAPESEPAEPEAADSHPST